MGYKKLNLIGQKIEKLTIIEEVKDQDHKKATYYRCICDCGNEKIIQGYNIGKSTKSCGCIKLSKKLSIGIAAFNALFRKYCKRAAERNYQFILSKEDFKYLTQQNCYYCGRKPEQVQKSGDGFYVYNGIDRKNNEVGYTLENCVPCCGICNKMKGTMSFNEFIEIINNIWQNLRRLT